MYSLSFLSSPNSAIYFLLWCTLTTMVNFVVKGNFGLNDRWFVIQSRILIRMIKHYSRNSNREIQISQIVILFMTWKDPCVINSIFTTFPQHKINKHKHNHVFLNKFVCCLLFLQCIWHCTKNQTPLVCWFYSPSGSTKTEMLKIFHSL